MPAYELGPGEVGLPANRPIPERNGKGYNPDWNPPSFERILQAADNMHTDEFVMVIIGRLYTGSTEISGKSMIVSSDDLYNAVLNHREGSSYMTEMRGLMALKPEQTDIHITHVILKPTS